MDCLINIACCCWQGFKCCFSSRCVRWLGHAVKIVIPREGHTRAATPRTSVSVVVRPERESIEIDFPPTPLPVSAALRSPIKHVDRHWKVIDTRVKDKASALREKKRHELPSSASCDSFMSQ